MNIKALGKWFLNTNFRNKKANASSCRNNVSQRNQINNQYAPKKKAVPFIIPNRSDSGDIEIEELLSLLVVTLIILLAYIIAVICLVVFNLPS